MKLASMTAIGICTALAIGCGSDRHEPASPDTSRETEEAVEAVGAEVEEGAEDTGEAIEKGVNEGAEEIEEETDD